MSGTGEWVTGSNISTPDSSESLSGPPPYSLINPLPQNMDYSPLQRVSKFVLVLSINFDVNFITWSCIKFLQANTFQYGQSGDTTEVMVHLEKAIRDFQAVSDAWNDFLHVLSDIHRV